MSPGLQRTPAGLTRVPSLGLATGACPGGDNVCGADADCSLDLLEVGCTDLLLGRWRGYRVRLVNLDDPFDPVLIADHHVHEGLMDYDRVSGVPAGVCLDPSWVNAEELGGVCIDDPVDPGTAQWRVGYADTLVSYIRARFRHLLCQYDLTCEFPVRWYLLASECAAGSQLFVGGQWRIQIATTWPVTEEAPCLPAQIALAAPNIVVVSDVTPEPDLRVFVDQPGRIEFIPQ